MKNSTTSQSTGGRNPNLATKNKGGFKIGVNYQAHVQGWKPSKHAKGKAKPNEQTR